MITDFVRQPLCFYKGPAWEWGGFKPALPVDDLPTHLKNIQRWKIASLIAAGAQINTESRDAENNPS